MYVPLPWRSNVGTRNHRNHRNHLKPMAKTHRSQCLNSHDVRSARSLGSKARLRVRAALQMSANTPHSLPISLRAPASLSAWCPPVSCLVPAWCPVWCPPGVLSGALLVSYLVPAWFLSGALLVPVSCLPGATTGAPSGAPPRACLVPALCPVWYLPGARLVPSSGA